MQEVNGYVETARYAGFTGGPLLGGLLSATGGVEAAMLAQRRHLRGRRRSRRGLCAPATARSSCSATPCVHQRVPAAAPGGPFAAYNHLRNAADLGALAAGGVLVATVGPRGTLWLAGGASALAGVAGLALRRRRAGPAAAPEAEAAASTIGPP